MGHITDSPGLDERRSAPTYADCVGETVVRTALRGPLTDWRLVGPRKVIQNARRGHDIDRSKLRPEDVSPGIHDPALSRQSVQVNLMPEVAAAMLRYLDSIAEPAPSRSGRSQTYRLKKKVPAVEATGTVPPNPTAK